MLTRVLCRVPRPADLYVPCSVSVFYHIGMSPSAVNTDAVDDPAGADRADTRAAQEHEFRIGCVGFGDTLGILVASIVSMPLQLELCSAQVARGYTLCKEV